MISKVNWVLKFINQSSQIGYVAGDGYYDLRCVSPYYAKNYLYLVPNTQRCF